MKKTFLTPILFLAFGAILLAQTKTIQIRLNGIFMGECGNNNHCTHEPITGAVGLYLAAETPGGTVMLNPTTGSRDNLIWVSDHYSLVCTNLNAYYASGEQGGGGASDDSYTSGPPIATNVWKSFHYQISEQDWQNNRYQMRLKFDLGSQHQDNPLASVGDHWTDTEFANFDFRSSPYSSEYSHLKTFGPFKTNSNRCHEYWLQFQIEVD